MPHLVPAIRILACGLDAIGLSCATVPAFAQDPPPPTDFGEVRLIQGLGASSASM